MARITKAEKIIDQMCPNFCPCCKSNKQWISHWLIDCPFFNHIRNDKILFLYNAFNHGNLTNNIVNSMIIATVIIVIVIIIIVIIVIVIIVIVILVIVFLVMLVIVLKIMCILILVCVK